MSYNHVVLGAKKALHNNKSEHYKVFSPNNSPRKIKDAKDELKNDMKNISSDTTLNVLPFVSASAIVQQFRSSKPLSPSSRKLQLNKMNLWWLNDSCDDKENQSETVSEITDSAFKDIKISSENEKDTLPTPELPLIHTNEPSINHSSIDQTSDKDISLLKQSENESESLSETESDKHSAQELLVTKETENMNESEACLDSIHNIVEEKHTKIKHEFKTIENNILMKLELSECLTMEIDIPSSTKPNKNKEQVSDEIKKADVRTKSTQAKEKCTESCLKTQLEFEHNICENKFEPELDWNENKNECETYDKAINCKTNMKHISIQTNDTFIADHENSANIKRVYNSIAIQTTEMKVNEKEIQWYFIYYLYFCICQ